MGDASNRDEAYVSYAANIAFELFKVVADRGNEFGPHPVTDEDQQLRFSGVALVLEPDAPVIVEVQFYSGLIDRNLVIKLKDFVPGALPSFVADNIGDDVFAYVEDIYGVPLNCPADAGRVVLDLGSGASHPE